MTEKGEELSTEELSRILERHKNKRNGLISILLEIQKEFGYLPKETMRRVAEFLGMEPVDVWGVATLFNQFRLTPLAWGPPAIWQAVV